MQWSYVMATELKRVRCGGLAGQRGPARAAKPAQEPCSSQRRFRLRLTFIEAWRLFGGKDGRAA